jgi:hypothetical protein
LLSFSIDFQLAGSTRIGHLLGKECTQNGPGNCHAWLGDKTGTEKGMHFGINSNLTRQQTIFKWP